MIKEFKAFIARGNVIDLAVGVIIGGAFGKIVSSLVNDVIMPLIGIISGGIDLKELSIVVGDAKIVYGSFIQSVLDFIIIAICIFVIIKLLSKFKRKKEEPVVIEAPPEPSREEELLTQIRDLLKEKNK
jgi:large conductance mechanosensitive channel